MVSTLSEDCKWLQEQVQAQINISPFRHVENLERADPSRKRRLTLTGFALDSDSSSSGAVPSDCRSAAVESLEYNMLLNLRAEYYELFDSLSRTVRGEGNSTVLLSGAYGSGKSALLAFALRQLRLKYGRGAFAEVYLNGRLEASDGDSLLRLVSALSAQSGASEKHSKSRFSENIEYLVAELRKCADGNALATVVVLDHCELFAQRRQLKQTLLYNLFDILASEHSRFTVVALSPHKSWTQFLEKRVSSRLEVKKIVVGGGMNYGVSKRILYDALLVGESAPKWQSHSCVAQVYNAWMERGVLANRKLDAWLKRKHYCGDSPQNLLVTAARISHFALRLFGSKDVAELQREYESEGEMEALESATRRRVVRGKAKGAQSKGRAVRSRKKAKSAVDGECVLEWLKADRCEWRQQVVAALSVVQLLLLTVACKLDHAGVEQFNFEMLSRRIAELRKSDCVLLHGYGQLQLLRAFRSLLSERLLVAANSGSQLSAFGSAAIEARFQLVRLNTGEGDASDWLSFVQRGHSEAPTWLREWLARTGTVVAL